MARAGSDDDLAWSIADRVLRGDERASTLVAEVFRERRDLDAKRRRAIASTAYGLLRWRRMLELVAGRDARLALRARLDGPERDEAVAEIEASSLAQLSPERRIATLGSLPEWLARRLIAQGGEASARSLAFALASSPPTCLRANPLRTDRDGLITALAREGIGASPLPRTTYGVVLHEGAYDLFATRAQRDGLFEVQDEGSQLIAEVVAPPPGSTVIDACAGEGGKTLAIAGMLGGKGRVIACDVSKRKLEVLLKRAARAGLSNVRTIALEREGNLPDELAKLRADRVLVDAPCSGVGSFRRNPEARFRIDEGVCERLPNEQRAIVERFLPLVAKGGRLIYATCTVLREENEAIVEWARSLDATLLPMRVAEIWGSARAAGLCDESGSCLKLRPDVQGTDGFFAGVLRRPR